MKFETIFPHTKGGFIEEKKSFAKKSREENSKKKIRTNK